MMHVSNAQAKEVTTAIHKGIVGTLHYVPATDMLDEITQATWLRILDTDTFDESRSLSAYANTTAHHVTLDYLKGRLYTGATKHERETEYETRSDDEHDPVMVEYASPEPSAYDTINARERDAHLQGIINDLPESQKRAIEAVIADTEPPTDSIDNLAHRQNKMRAINTLTEEIKICYKGTAVRSRNKGRKRL